MIPDDVFWGVLEEHARRLSAILAPRVGIDNVDDALNELRMTLWGVQRGAGFEAPGAVVVYATRAARHLAIDWSRAARVVGHHKQRARTWRPLTRTSETLDGVDIAALYDIESSVILDDERGALWRAVLARCKTSAERTALITFALGIPARRVAAAWPDLFSASPNAVSRVRQDILRRLSSARSRNAILAIVDPDAAPIPDGRRYDPAAGEARTERGIAAAQRIAAMRAARVPWSEIGRALGISGPAARMRYQHYVSRGEVA